MSLYLCIFDEDEELDGVAVGSYSDFGNLRDTVASMLEQGQWGTRFPTLMLHSDCDGEWAVADCAKLVTELETIITEMKGLPAREFSSDWQKKQARTLGLHPKNLYESFIDVDGETLLDRMLGLVRLAQTHQLPILFQ